MVSSCISIYGVVGGSCGVKVFQIRLSNMAAPRVWTGSDVISARHMRSKPSHFRIRHGGGRGGLHLCGRKMLFQIKVSNMATSNIHTGSDVILESVHAL